MRLQQVEKLEADTHPFLGRDELGTTISCGRREVDVSFIR
jgi:hypothetical protein